jgi:cathepsin L
MEARMKLDTGNITALSEQYLLDCNTARACQGCCGGLSERALQWLAGDSGGLPGEGQGIASEAAYPYVSESGNDPTSGQCNHAAPLVAKLKGFGMLASPSAESVVSAATQYGVLATSMDAHALQFYKSGIITNSQNCSNSDHAVAVVGYGTEGGVDFLKVRNSYGTQFGESGYFRISRQAADDCGLYSCVVAGTSGPPSPVHL